MLVKGVVLAMTLFCIALVESAVISNPIHTFNEPALKDGHVLHPNGANQLIAPQGRNHSLILGRRVYGDRLLHIDVAKKSSKLFRVVETDVVFPAYGTKNNKTITYLQVIDRLANGNNGWPYLTFGGVGAKNVTVHFKSQRSYGLDFIVYIYGYNN